MSRLHISRGINYMYNSYMYEFELKIFILYLLRTKLDIYVFIVNNIQVHQQKHIHYFTN